MDQILSPAASPIGRWHHDGQRALYLSGTREGCAVALRAYARPDDPPRSIVPIQVADARIIDLRDPATRNALHTSLSDIHTFWAKLHAAGSAPPTWDLADQVRAAGACGLLTPSRSRPELTHLTLFHWNITGHATLTPDGPAEPFHI